MLPEAEQTVRVMAAARLDRERAEAELAREEGAASPAAVSIGDPDYMAELEATATVLNTEAVLDSAAESGWRGSGGAGRCGRSVTVDMEAYERARALLRGRAAERRQSEEYREALRARLGSLDESERPLYAPCRETPLERYMNGLRNG